MGISRVDIGGLGDYPTLNAWWLDVQAVFSEPEIAECSNSNGNADTTAIDINGATTSAANYVLVKDYTGFANTGIYNDAKYRLTGTDNTILDISENYVRIENIQFGITITADNSGYCIQVTPIGAPSDIRIDANIFKGVSIAGTGFCRAVSFTDADGTSLLRDNYFLDIISGGDNGFRAVYLSNGTLKAAGNTIINCYHAFYQGGGTGTLLNNVIANCTDDIYGTWTIDPGYNVHDDDDTTNSEGPLDDDWDKEVEDIGADDVRPLNSGNLFEHSIIAYDDDNDLRQIDIVGNARTTTSGGPVTPGCFENVAVGGLSIPVAMHHYTKNIGN